MDTGIIHRVALYARFSSDNQRTESLDAQIRAMKKYCREKHYLIVRTYTDSAKSGTTDKRPGFQQMIADSAKKEFDIILCHKLDRFARNRYDSAYYRKKLRKNNVSVYSVLENLNDSPESIILESLLEGMSEYYSKNLSREVQKGLKENALKCKHTGGLPPLGYSINEEKLMVINEDEAPIIRLIFDLYDKGFQYTYIMKKLYDLGYKTRRGNDFNKNSLHEILRNEKYCGTYFYSRTAAKSSDNKRNGHKSKPADQIIRIEDGCPAIIPKEQFLRVSKRLATKKYHQCGNNGREYYLLRGKVVCGVCGNRMSGSSRYSGNKKYYQSTYRCQKIRQICGNREINRIYLDQFVNQYMKEKIFTLESLKRIKTAYDVSVKERTMKRESDIGDLKVQVNSINNQIDSIVSIVEKGIINENIYAKLDSLNKRKQELEQNLHILSAFPVSNIAWSPEEVMEEFQRAEYGTEEYRNILQRFIKEVRVFPYEVQITLKAGEIDDRDIPGDLGQDFQIIISRKELYTKFGSKVVKATKERGA